MLSFPDIDLKSAPPTFWMSTSMFRKISEHQEFFFVIEFMTYLSLVALKSMAGVNNCADLSLLFLLSLSQKVIEVMAKISNIIAVNLAKTFRCMPHRMLSFIPIVTSLFVIYRVFFCTRVLSETDTAFPNRNWPHDYTLHYSFWIHKHLKLSTENWNNFDRHHRKTYSEAKYNLRCNVLQFLPPGVCSR